MAYEKYCASCREISENLDCGKYYCFMKGEDVYACDPRCNNWGEAYSRSDSGRENMYKNSQSSLSGGCYLTTAMCDILGYPDDNYYLQMLRTLRDETLKKDFKYIPILLTYDIIGPQIAQNLKQDPSREKIAKTLFSNYIIKAVDAIENNKIQETVNIYIAMTNSLARRYNINTHALYIDPKSINIETLNMDTLGHGRTRTKRLEEITNI